MKTIIVLVFVVVAGAFLADAFRKRNAAQKRDSTGRFMLNANDAPPTETGRMRVQAIVASLKKSSGESQPADEAAKEEEKQSSEPLPDPFDKR